MQEKNETDKGSSMDNTVRSGFTLTASVAPQMTGLVGLVQTIADLIHLSFSKLAATPLQPFSKSVAQVRKKSADS